jgi:myosin heavy subunit
MGDHHLACRVLKKIMPEFGLDQILYGKSKLFMRLPAVAQLEQIRTMKVELLDVAVTLRRWRNA